MRIPKANFFFILLFLEAILFVFFESSRQKYTTFAYYDFSLKFCFDLFHFSVLIIIFYNFFFYFLIAIFLLQFAFLFRFLKETKKQNIKQLENYK